MKNPRWLPRSVVFSKSIPLIIFFLPIFLYRDCFLKEYFINDEMGWLGNFSHPLSLARESFFRAGRPFTGLSLAVVYNFVEDSFFKIAFIRSINLISMAGLATVLFFIVKKNSKSNFLSACFAVALICQLTYQGFIAYGLHFISGYQSAFWLSLGSVILFFGRSHAFKKTKYRGGVSFLLLLISFHCSQPITFFCLVPLSALILFDDGKKQQDIRAYLFLLLSAFVLAMFIYILASNSWIKEGRQIHSGAQLLFHALSKNPTETIFLSLNPIKYHSAFELWTYPSMFSIRTLALASKKNIEVLILFLWLILWASVFIKELLDESKQRKTIYRKHFLFLACCVLAAFLLVLDSPLETVRHREHIRYVFSNVILISFFYFFKTVLSGQSEKIKKAIKIVTVILLLILLNGASFNFQQNFVGVAESELSFIFEKIKSRKEKPFNRIIIVYPKENFCIQEPCSGWSGSVVRGYDKGKSERKRRREGVYKYAMKRLGIDYRKINLQYWDKKNSEAEAEDLLIDWNEYLELRRATSRKT